MGWVAMVTTVLLAMFTGVYVLLTYRLLKEAQRARIAQNQSEIVVDVTCEDFDFVLLIENIGQSSAQNIRIKFTPPLRVFLGEHDTATENLYFAGLGRSQIRRFHVDIAARLLSSDLPRQYSVNASWDCPVSGARVSKTVIDLDSWENTIKERPAYHASIYQDYKLVNPPTSTTPQS